MTTRVGAVLFDLDGTLIDSAPDLAGACNDMRLERGLEPLPYETLRSMVGSGARGMVGAGFGLTPDDPGYFELRDEFLSRYEARMTLETRVFADVLPEFRNLRPPRLLKPQVASALDVRQYVGRYIQAQTIVDIKMDEDGLLRLSVIQRGAEAAVTPARRLRPAENNVFLSEVGGDAEFLFVQFIATESSPGSQYLWNGRQVWRRQMALAD